jgi:hypothetical protein
VRDAVIREVTETEERVDAVIFELNDIVPNDDRDGEALEDGEDVDDVDDEAVREARIDEEGRFDTEDDGGPLKLGEDVADVDADGVTLELPERVATEELDAVALSEEDGDLLEDGVRDGICDPVTLPDAHELRVTDDEGHEDKLIEGLPELESETENVALVSEEGDLDDWAEKDPEIDDEAVRVKAAVRVIVDKVVFENVALIDPERDDSRVIVELPLSLTLEELDVETDGDVEIEVEGVKETLE